MLIELIELIKQYQYNRFQSRFKQTAGNYSSPAVKILEENQKVAVQ